MTRYLKKYVIINFMNKIKIDINKLKTIGFYLLLFVLSLAMTTKSNGYDFDLWARLIAGMAVVQTGQILKYDFLSYTPTHAWYDHEWGSSVVFYLFKNLGGTYGLLFLQALLIFLTMFFLVKTVKVKFAEKCNCENILIFFIILNAFLVTYSSLIRCHSFTFLFFAFELYLLELVRKNQNYKLLFILPLLFLIWGNMHGGVVSGLGLLVMYTIGEALNKKNFKYYLIASLICPLMLFINPYGVEFVKFLLSATTMHRPDVLEWYPIFNKMTIFKFMTFKIFAIFVLMMELIKVIKNKINYKSFDKTKFMVLLITLYLAIIHIKMMPFFVLSATIFCYKDVIDLFKNIKFPKYGMVFMNIFLLIFSVALMSIKTWKPMVKCKLYPILEVEFIKENQLKGNILVNFGLGSYVAYKLYPQNKIYMDGRYEEVYDDYLLEDMSKTFTLSKGWYNLFEKNSPDIIIIEKFYPLYKGLKQKKSGWKLAFEGLKFGVFVKTEKFPTDLKMPTLDFNYYKQSLFDTNITFKGENRIKIEEINKRNDK